MIVEVEMHAFGKRQTEDGEAPIRRVDVPGASWRLTTDELAQLELVFAFGQNERQPLPLPSVSVGDIVRLGGKRFVALPFGFREVAADFQPPAGDRGGFYAYTLNLTEEEDR